MASNIKHHDFKRLFRRYGVEFEPGGKHPRMYKYIDGRKFFYPYALEHGNEVKHCYVQSARRKFKLTPDDGVSDEEFFG